MLSKIVSICNIFAFLLICGCFSNQLLAKDTANLQTQLAAADSLRLAGENEAAKTAYEEILKQYKNEPAAYAGLGAIAFLEENYGKANDFFNKVIDVDSENINAYYHSGICYRELGVHMALLMRKIAWGKSNKRFEWVLAQDSTYKDVLYQFARLKRYRGKYEEAIEACHAQIDLKPELLTPQIHLYRFYKYLIKHRDEDDAIEWLTKQSGTQAKFFIGEKLRREDKYEKADSVYKFVITNYNLTPVQPLYLALVRVNFAQDRPEIADNYYWDAVAAVFDHLSADLIFEDIKYIVTDAEWDNYTTLATYQEKIEFFRNFWQKRDPMPSFSQNVRIAEHYRRLLYAEKWYEYDGFRGWHGNPDTLGYLDFPATNTLNDEFNDKGLIYIRHGQPNDIAITGGFDVPFNESWLYYGSPQRAQMTFHFMVAKGGNDWRFTPIIKSPAILEDRLTWDGIYYQLLKADDLERMGYEQKMADMSRENVRNGLSTDQHTWQDEIQPLETPCAISTFRGTEGQTLVDITCGIPANQLLEYGADEGDTSIIEKGFSLHHNDYEVVHKEQTKAEVPLYKDKTYIDLYRFEVEPDTYRVAFHAKPENTPLLGGMKFVQNVRDYSDTTLTLSDIQLASIIRPAEKEGPYVKNGLLVVPSPALCCFQERPAYVYFEIYNLNLDPLGFAHYTIEYTLKLEKEKGGGIGSIFGLFGGKKKQATSIKTEREANAEFSPEYISLDVSNLKKGTYELVVKVFDNNTQVMATQSRQIALL